MQKLLYFVQTRKTIASSFFLLICTITWFRVYLIAVEFHRLLDYQSTINVHFLHEHSTLLAIYHIIYDFTE